MVVELNDGRPNLFQPRGFALVAALLLLVLVGIVTATVLHTTSIEIKISGNQKQAVQEFYAAEAGLAEARVRLRRQAGLEHLLLYEPSQRVNPFWSAYLLTSSEWSFADDPHFSPQYKNFIPLPGNPNQTNIQINSLQSDLHYWVRVRHKTEYDAEQAGHGTHTPHYLDQDGSLARHQASTLGNIIYYGFPYPEAPSPQPFTIQGLAPWFPIELISSYGGSRGTGIHLQIEAIHPPGPNQVGALYVTGNLTLVGQHGLFNGNDACGFSPSLPPLYYGGSLTAGAGMQFAGLPDTPVQGSLEIDMARAIEDLRRGAKSIYADLVNQQLSSATIPETYLVRISQLFNPNRLLLKNTSGFGILLIDGSTVVEGQVKWEGMILVKGNLIIQGNDTLLSVQGGMWAESVHQIGGMIQVEYNSCLIQEALLSQPLRVHSWKEVF